MSSETAPDGSRSPSSALPSGSARLTDQTLADVESSEAAYLASIDKLSSLARKRLQNSASPIAVADREKLLLLDSAIAEMRGEMERNRFNTHLRRELLAMYREKQRTLQDLMKGGLSVDVRGSAAPGPPAPGGRRTPSRSFAPRRPERRRPRGVHAHVLEDAAARGRAEPHDRAQQRRRGDSRRSGSRR